MSRRWILVAVLVVLAVGAAGTVWFGQPQKTVLTIEVTGRPGLTVKGTAEVDGTKQELTGSVPTKLVLEGYKITYSLANTQDAGEIRAKAIIADAATGSTTTGDPPKYTIRGWVRTNWWWSPPISGIESFDPEDDPGWRFPPP